MVNIDRYGNTSAASIPIALAEAADDGRMKDGDLVLLSGFGAGMTWASAVLRWGRPGGPPREARRDARTDRRVALVTGGSRGIGRATAVALAAAGHRVAVCYRADADGAARDRRRRRREPGGEALAVAADVADPGAVDAAFKEIEADLGRWRSWSTTPASPATGCCCA